jgi:hypothetical protein
MIILATIGMIPYTFTVITISFFVTLIPSKSHSVAVFITFCEQACKSDPVQEFFFIFFFLLCCQSESHRAPGNSHQEGLNWEFRIPGSSFSFSFHKW